MNDLLSLFWEAPMAAAFGAAGLACQLGWPLCSTRRGMLMVQVGVGLFFGVQYALLGAGSGAGVCFIGASQTFVALLAGKRHWARFGGYAFLPAIIVVGYLTWGGIASLLVVTASLLNMTGRMQANTFRLRSFMLAAAPLGISYDLVVGAAPALIGACLSAAIAATRLVQEFKNRRRYLAPSHHAPQGSLLSSA